MDVFTVVIGLLQGVFFIDAFRLNVWFAKRLSGKRLREQLEDPERRPRKLTEDLQAFGMLSLGLVLAVAAILLIPGLTMAGIFNGLRLSHEVRELQIRIWSWSLVIGLVGRSFREQRRGRW